MLSLHVTCAFVSPPSNISSSSTGARILQLSRAKKKDNHEEGDNNSNMLDEISWRTAKLKLEEADQRSFQQRLKRKPIKLPYLEARRWVQYNLGPDTREEFFDLVANGNLRTPYIPKQPDEYYTGTGDWISWDHFLTMDPKVAGRIVPPATGRFD